MKRILLALCLIALAPSQVWASLQTQLIEYKQGDAVMEGYLSYDDKFSGERPGVLVIHEWWGLNDYAKMRADKLAGLGYVAFAADIYGKGIRPVTPEEAGIRAGQYKNDRKLFREHLQAALEVLKSQPNVDSARLAAIGYCFGGTGVLELARSGADLKAAVSFHGGLSTPTPADAKNIKARLLILHGAADPYVPPEEVAAFKKEMKAAKVKYTLIKYPSAMHGFTNPANKGELPGAKYNAEADLKSWNAMKRFLKRELASTESKPKEFIMALKEHDKAPVFELPDQSGRKVKLADYKGQWVLVYFYPKDDTPGCTKEACTLEDRLPDFGKAGFAVLGISPDSVESHAKFAKKYKLTFTLLADETKDVIRRYGAWGPKTFMGKTYEGVIRSSFLVDPDGRIAKIYPKVDPETHAEDVWKDFQELKETFGKR